MSTHDIKIDISLDKPLKQSSNEELALGLDAELNKFTGWFRSKGNEPLIKIERAIVKTYLAWKLLYEERAEEES